MNVTIAVTRETNESNASLLRRFSKKVTGAGVISAVKKIKFRQRPLSALKRKNSALKRQARQREWLQLKKWGKLPAVSRVRHHR